jgi:ring-1,2-phenylacetyl-CoA epoxidase subunit PaaD
LVSAQALVNDIPDPEIPVVTLHDLGIVRSVEQSGMAVMVRLTPTYSGCPATEAIKQQVQQTLTENGYGPVTVSIELSPAWTTDWISEAGREKLKQYGIAPPHQTQSQLQKTSSNNLMPLQFFPPRQGVRCPRCDSLSTQQISRFGSTPCKSLYQCTACKEPFDYFKPL